MKIIRDRDNAFYSKKNRDLGNCFTIIHDKEYYYEFIINNIEAKIKCNDTKFINDAINEFRYYNLYITTFYTENREFYKAFDPVFSFKLPINCIQPSQFFIDNDKLDIIENYMDEDKIYLPVCILDDEYVLLDGHTRLYAMYKNYNKLVNVYIDKPFEGINDFIYIAKENNIFKISNLQVLSHEEYDKLWNGFCDEYFGRK